ncbi:hypothetical protein D2962_09795 [Biomaibacter acetigenes]|uniref:Uncharacterized protein n=1 Tax=Biomaibacter acetigenes TaxID=2316383 RepID=A0A3G2R609_9FIRM|nr:hypothetical protein [Biomaibacter acetigenes]AYO30872.1 hypothetical protein D2962_09795 [Biomaibacter acetigenes]
MRLHTLIDEFVRTRDPQILRRIKRDFGGIGFSTACRAAGISRGHGKRLLGIYDDTIAIRQLASKIGYREVDYR